MATNGLKYTTKQKGEGSLFVQGDSVQIVLVGKQNHSRRASILEQIHQTQELNFSSHKGAITLAKFQRGPLSMYEAQLK